jgi:hypothetical protein
VLAAALNFAVAGSIASRLIGARRGAYSAVQASSAASGAFGSFGPVRATPSVVLALLSRSLRGWRGPRSRRWPAAAVPDAAPPSVVPLAAAAASLAFACSPRAMPSASA